LLPTGCSSRTAFSVGKTYSFVIFGLCSWQ